MTCFLITCQPEGFLDPLANFFERNFNEVRLPRRNQQSLKLYTSFFILVNKKINFCRLADHSSRPDLFLGFGLDSRAFRLALRLLTAISRALNSIPIFSSRSNNFENLFCLQWPALSPHLTSRPHQRSHSSTEPMTIEEHGFTVPRHPGDACRNHGPLSCST